MNIRLPEQIIEALDSLNRGGFEAYAVGGCVRDSLLEKRPGDWDITTNAKPGEMKLCFPRRRVIETGLKHGTLTVLFDNLPVEITTYRIDSDYSDHRRPDSVTFTDDLSTDLSRRDFTINALAYHPQKGLIDYFGGLKDIEARRIICVGKAVTRFSEDALRILRAVRFSATLGFEIERDTLTAMNELAVLLDNISRERVASELNKALTGEFIGEALLQYAGIFARIIPELETMFGFDQYTKYHHLDVWRHTVEAVKAMPNDLVLRIVMLLHDSGKPSTFTLDEQGGGHFYGHAEASAAIADLALSRLRYDNAARKRIIYLIERHCDLIRPEIKQLKRKLNRMGEEKLRQLIAVKRADSMAQAPGYRPGREENLRGIERILDEIISQNQAFCLKDLAVNGKDLLQIGFEPGKRLGETLEELLRLVMDERLSNEREELIAAAKELLDKPA